MPHLVVGALEPLELLYKNWEKDYRADVFGYLFFLNCMHPLD